MGATPAPDDQQAVYSPGGGEAGGPDAASVVVAQYHLRFDHTGAKVIEVNPSLLWNRIS